MWDVTVGKTIVVVVLSGGGRSNIKRSLSSVQAHRVFCVSCVFSHLVCSRIVLVTHHRHSYIFYYRPTL